MGLQALQSQIRVSTITNKKHRREEAVGKEEAEGSNSYSCREKDAKKGEKKKTVNQEM